MAEAMLSGLAVITTAWGGQCDFCTQETAWLIDYTFAPAETLFGSPHSVWAEPSRACLASLMREVHLLSAEARSERTQRGQQLLRKHFKWEDVARRLLAFARHVSSQSLRAHSPRLGWIGSGTFQGSEADRQVLLDRLPGNVVLLPDGDQSSLPESFQKRCCRERPEMTSCISGHESDRVNAVLIEYCDDCFPQERLAAVVQEQRQKGRVIVLMLREFADPILSELSFLRALAGCDRVLVSGVDELNLLKQHGIIENAAILPLDAHLGAVNVFGPGSRLWGMIQALILRRSAVANTGPRGP
jgi:hypothetical protein